MILYLYCPNLSDLQKWFTYGPMKEGQTLLLTFGHISSETTQVNWTKHSLWYIYFIFQSLNNKNLKDSKGTLHLYLVKFYR